MGTIKSKILSLADRERKRSGHEIKLGFDDIFKGNNVSFTDNIKAEPDSMTHLTASHASIKSIPEDIGRYRNLKNLDLSNNLIEYIPWSVVYLKELEILDLSHNQLTKLPSTMFYFPKLISLDLSYNLFERLPIELLLYNKLETLNVEGNLSLVSPPLDLCLQGKEAIFTELEKRQSRTNAWARWKPYYTGQFTCLQTLVEICIESIIYSKLDYLASTTIPPTVKNYLSSAEKHQVYQISLMKCSTCRAYFTKDYIFDNHMCYRRGVYRR